MSASSWWSITLSFYHKSQSNALSVGRFGLEFPDRMLELMQLAAHVVLFDAENVRQLIHQLFFGLAVNALDLWELQSFLAQFENGHLLQIFPFHKNLPECSCFGGRFLPQNYGDAKRSQKPGSQKPE